MAVPDGWKYHSLHRQVQDLAQTIYGTQEAGTAFFVNGATGSDTANDGLSPGRPFATVKKAYDSCTTEKHDVVYLIASDTSDKPLVTLEWSKHMTHLIGLGPEFPGIGCRSQFTAATALALNPVILFSGRGCIVKNIQVQNAYEGASGGVTVSGPYNYFENCYFNGMNHASGGAEAASFCLTVSGAENYFKRCTIGSCQTIRVSTNAELVISNGAQLFEDCLIQKYSETATNFLVRLQTGTAGLSLIRFKDCVFYCQTVNWAAGITDVFDVDQTGSHYVLLKECTAIGGTGAGISWSNVVTHIYHDQAAPATGGGIAIAVNA
jgi:hypothetical protein